MAFWGWIWLLERLRWILSWNLICEAILGLRIFYSSVVKCTQMELNGYRGFIWRCLTSLGSRRCCCGVLLIWMSLGKILVNIFFMTGKPPTLEFFVWIPLIVIESYFFYSACYNFEAAVIPFHLLNDCQILIVLSSDSN